MTAGYFISFRSFLLRFLCSSLVLLAILSALPGSMSAETLDPCGDPGLEVEASLLSTPPNAFVVPGPNKRVDLIFRGLKNLLPTRLNIPDPASVEKVYIEVVYKGKLPATSLHKAILAKLSSGLEIILEPKLVKGAWGQDGGVAIFFAEVGKTDRVSLDFEVEEASAQSMMLYVLRTSVSSASYQAGVYASVFGYSNTKTFEIPVPRDTRTRDIKVTLPITEITSDGRVLDFVIAAGAKQVSFRRQWNSNFPFDNECCIDTVQATLRAVTGDFDKVSVTIISPPSSQSPAGQSYVLSGIIQADVSPVCAPLNVTLPKDVCTDNTVVLNSKNPAPGYTATWDFGIGAHPRYHTGFDDVFLMFDQPGQQAVSVLMAGPDCASSENFSFKITECSVTKCALEGALVIQHPAHGNNDGVIELDMCVACGSTPPYRVFYTYRGQQVETGPFTQSKPRLTGLPTGTYEQIYVIDANGCQTNVTGPVTLCNGGCGQAPTCPEQICTLTGFNDQGRKRVFWLPSLGLDDVRWRWENGTGEFVVTGAKSALIRGRVVSISDPSCGFEINMVLRDRRTWTEWSAKGRDWKGNRTRIKDNQHLDWDYYELVPDVSTFKGFGCFNGTLKLTPRPADYKYGVQVGEGANDQNLSPGISAWFAYVGQLNGKSISGEGDINAEGTCRFQDMTRNAVPILSCAPDYAVSCGGNSNDAPKPTINCGNAAAYSLTFEDREISSSPKKIERTWTAAGPGGPATCKQILTFGDNVPPVFTKVPIASEMSCEAVAAQSAQARDECGTVKVEVRETKFNETCPGNYDLRRVWTATDESGNTATIEVIVKVVDKTGPIFTAPPGDIVLECKDPMPTDNPGTADACGGSVSIDYAVSECQSATPLYTWTGAELIYLVELPNPGLNYTSSMKPLALAAMCSDQPSLRRRWRVSNTNDYPVYLNSIEAYAKTVYKGLIIPAKSEVFFFTKVEAGTENVKIHWEDASGKPLLDSKSSSDSKCVDLSAAETCTCVITRRWTARDECGNTSVYEQKIWQRDTKAPTMRDIPADRSVSSEADVPAAGNVTATDDCTKAVVGLNETRIPSSEYGCAEAAVHFAFGHKSAALPLLLLNGRAFRIGEQPLLIKENCDGSASVTGKVIDAANPAASFELSLKLKDRRSFAEHSAAAGSAPSQCNSADKNTWRFYAFDTDSKLTGTGGNSGIVLTIAALSGGYVQLGAGANNANCKLGLFGNFSYQASTGSYAGSEGTLQTAYVSVDFNESGNCKEGFTLIRVYSAVDECGNRSIERQVVRVVDGIAPELEGLPSDLSLQCGATIPNANVTGTDNSNSPVTIELAEKTTGTECKKIITRTWTATDACGNTSTGQQVITIEDTNGPVITFNSPAMQGLNSGDLLVVSCSNLPIIDESITKLSDNCDANPTLSFTDEQIGQGDCATQGYSVRYRCTWTATDKCGNTTVFFIFVEIHDDEKPVLTKVPPAVTQACSIDLPSTQPVATDNCTNSPKITEALQTVPGSCSNSYQIVRLWTATDNCGNTATASQVVTLTDRESPQISAVPANVTLTCAQSLPSTQPKVSDGCDKDVRLVETQETRPGTCAGNYEIVRLWTATDNCGNTVTASQLITVLDNESPTLAFTNSQLKDFKEGQELVVDCGSVPRFSNLDAIATDNCDRNPTVTYSEEASTLGDCGNDGFVQKIRATWSATDGCGNTSKITILLRVRDIEKPTIASVPSDITISCDQSIPTSQPTVSDNCSSGEELRVEETSVTKAGTCSESYQVIRTWKVTDACGNISEAKQTITVQDKQRPSLAAVPESVTLSCEEALPTALPTVSDNCDIKVEVSFSDSSSPGSCAAVITLVRTFTATDNCGNTATASQTITIRDTKAPVFAQVPEGVTISCSAALPTTVPKITDNCDQEPKLLEQSKTRAGNCPDQYEIVRTWVASDACGNSATASQVITVKDTEAPVLAGVPENTSISCDEPLPTAKPTATDNCDKEVNVAVTQTTRPGVCANSYELVRQFTATDNCGNTATATQIVLVQDKTKPVFSSLPPNVQIGCTGAIPKNLPSATDNCDGQVAVIETQDQRAGPCPGSYEIVRIFSATDKCGNVATASQVINVQDIEAPIFAYVPADVSISCAEALPNETPQVSDACDKAVKVIETQSTRPGSCAGNYEMVRLFTATDNCGNSSTASQLVRVFDDKAPVFANVPIDITINCSDQLPTATPDITDNCDSAPKLEVSETREAGNCPDSYRMIRVWTAIDQCGNKSNARQVVTVTDVTAPLIANVPGNITISCSQVLPISKPSATDNCDQEVVLTEKQNTRPGSCANSYQVIRSWTATDNCGNASTASQVVTVEDREAPVFAGVPAAITIACNESLPSVGPQVSDNCDTEVAINETQTTRPGSCPEAYEIIRLWTATDNCGNVASASQLVIVVDKVAPEFAFVPSATTLSCEQALPPEQPELSDNCDQNVSIVETRSTSAGNCPGNSILTRLWTATDNCGNTATASQLVTVQDKVAPTFANVPQATTISCTDVLPITVPLLSDNCDKAPVLSETQLKEAGTCPGNYRVVRLWTASDACGNTATASQIVTVTDEVKPVFTEVPPSISLSCEDALPTVLAKASDNCDTQVNITEFQTRQPGRCGGGFIVVRLFMATDHCGNTATATQTVTFEDRKPPVFASIPPAVTIECDASLPASQPTASDNCDQEVQITEKQSTEAGACTDNYRVIRVWTATDDCGNTATATQVVSVRDTKVPSFVSVPQEVTIECNDALPKDLAQATDNCDKEVSVTATERRENGACEDSYAIIRIFTATDNCGNTATATQRVNVRDTQAPTFASVPTAVTVACEAALPSTPAKAIDNCDQQITITEQISRVEGSCTDNYQVIRLFTAIDNCGNTATATQIITIEDKKAPVFANVPAGVSLACDAPLPTTAPTATDNCDKQVEVVETQRTEAGKCSNAFITIRVWTATDNCGNTTLAEQRVERTDKTAPTFANVPTGVSIACDQALPKDLPVVRDNCDPAPTVTETQRTVPGACTSGYQVIRTFTASDACGNTATASQTVQVEDKQAPRFVEVPPTVTIACHEQLPASSPTATDNCDQQVAIAETQEFLRSGCAGNYRVIRKWTATDDCGNTATATQLVTVQDLVAPVIASVPAALSISCEASLPTTMPTAADNCDNKVHLAETQQRMPGGCADSYTLVRLFTATDECGNKATASQVVTIKDEGAPVLSNVPPNSVIACEEPLPTDQPSASDRCDKEVTITESQETIAGACPDAFTVVRIWTATDNCGNTATASQRIDVGDRSEPTFISVPADVTVWCGEALPTDQAIAVDNCDGNPGIVETSRTETGRCKDSYRIIRLWTASDACGNVATATQTVTVEDKTAPEFVSVPPAITISCEHPLPTTQPRVRDNCATEVKLSERTDRNRGQCEDGYTITRIWTATDNCGNSTTASQVVTIQDLAPPTFASVPSSVTISCEQSMPDGEPTATDNCDKQVKVTRRDKRVEGGCADSYSLVREWTAIDNCGNTATATQVVTVIDSNSPVFTKVPPALTLACSVGLPTSKPEASDLCDKKVEIVESQEILQGVCPDSYVVIRTWIASDNCGNTARATQEVTVIDNSPPKFAKVPSSRTVNCDEDPGDAQPVASDDCDQEVAITMTETTSGTDCRSGITLTRVWTASDNCGNTATVSQVIRFQDTDKPVFGNFERTLTIECDQPVPVLYPTATDNCDREVDVTYFDKRDNKPCGATITRTWVASDDCGNTNSATQLIVIRDSKAPLLNGVPSATQITCNQTLPLVDVTASDNCAQNLLVSYEEIQVPGRCAGELIVTRIWSAVDDCGNETIGTQEVTITDGSAPVFTNVPAAVTLACGQTLPKDKPSATDDCGGGEVQVAVTERTEPGRCASNYRIIRLFTATDKCGNSTTTSQVITLHDSDKPVLTGVPGGVTINCGEALPKASPTATDGCDNSPQLSLTERNLAGDCADRYEIVRTWTAVDNCGNTATASQTIKVIDTKAPVFSGVPKNLSLACNEPVPTVSPTATDNCAKEVIISLVETRTDQSAGYTLVRVWTASDNCGNTSTASQIITISPGGAPTFTFVPEAIQLSCGSPIPNAEARAQDACGGVVTVVMTEKRKEGKCPGNPVITRTWTARSLSGSTATASQTITLQDDVAPVFVSVPAALSLNCGAPTPSEMPLVSDNCSQNVKVTVDEARRGGECASEIQIVRTFTATDECGNKATASQVVTFKDREAPIFTFVPDSEEYQCSIGQARKRAQATDNCTPNVQITYTDVSPSTDCSQRLQRIWLATDQCGNTATAVQQILLEDTERPTLVGVPGNLNVDRSKGEQIPTPAQVTASDGCDSAPIVRYEQQQVPGAGCGYVLVRTWQAVDRCGNSARSTQRITVLEGGSTSIQVEPFGDCAPSSIPLRAIPQSPAARYLWTTSGGSFDDATSATPNFIPNGVGTYTISLLVSGGACNGQATTTLEITQPGLKVSSNAPICVGSELNLTATAGAKTYQWSGPNGFTSTQQNPLIPAAQASMSGVYRLTATFVSCTLQAETAVSVSDQLDLDLTVPQQVCAGESFALSIKGVKRAIWIAPGGASFDGTNIQVPPGSFADYNGTWKVDAWTDSGCKGWEMFTINVIRPPVTKGSSNSPVCGGAEIRLQAVGASSYVWSGPAGFNSTEANPVITDLRPYSAGSYKFIVTGTNPVGCKSRDTILVVVSGASAVQASAPSQVCVGEDIRLLASGAESYLWTGPGNFASTESSPVIRKAGAAGSGVYTLHAETSQACNVTKEFKIEVITDPVTNALTYNATCSDGGSISIEAGADVIFDWADLNGTSDPGNRAGLVAGTYILNASLGTCVKTYRFEIGDDCAGNDCDLPFQNAVVSTQPKCGKANASISVPVREPQRFSWTWLPKVSTSNQADQLEPGLFSITATSKSDSSCTRTYRIILQDQPGFELDINVINESCESKASVTLVPSAPGNYTVVWSDNSSPSTNLWREGLSSGTYTVSINDVQGCSLERVVIVGNDCDCEAKVSVVRARQASVCLDGSKTFIGLVKVTPGTVPASFKEKFLLAHLPAGTIIDQNDSGIFDVAASGEFSIHQLICNPVTLDSSLYATGSTIAGLEAKLIQGGGAVCGVLTAHGARVKTQVCCTSPLVADITTIDAGCTTATGVATIKLVNPSQDDRFTWSPSVGVRSNISGSKFEQLPAGIYHVDIQRGNDAACKITVSLTIGTDEIEAGRPKVLGSECGANSGSIRFPDAAPSLVFAWSDGGIGATRSDLAPGQYGLVISSTQSSCTQTDEILVPSISALEVATTVVKQPSCGASDGEVRLEVRGGSGDYSFDWGLNASKDKLAAGVYTVVVTDNGNGCTASHTFSLSEKAAGPAEIKVSDVELSCFGASDGKPVYTIDYDPQFSLPPTVSFVDAQNNPVRLGELGPGTYCILVRDKEGCLAASKCFAVKQPLSLTASARNQAATCTVKGSLKLQVAGGTPPYSYDWQHLASANDPQEVVDLDPGLYSVLIRDAKGCSIAIDDIKVESTCGTNPQSGSRVDTIKMIVGVERTKKECFRLEAGFPITGTNYVLTNGLMRGSSRFGSWTLDAAGCLSYTAGSQTGRRLDTISVIATNGQLRDRTLFIVDIQFQSPTGGRADTMIVRQVNQSFKGRICLAELQLPTAGPFMTLENVCPKVGINPKLDFSFDVATQCILYTGVLAGLDTLCLQMCSAAGCDTIVLQVRVLAPKPTTLDFVLERGQSGSVCLDSAELASPIVERFNFCPAESGRAVSFTLDETIGCVTWTGESVGSERACYVICNAFVCDTTYINVRVTVPSGNRAPVAVDDREMTTRGAPVTLNILSNDSLNGPLEQLLPIVLPSLGNIRFMSDSLVRYTPNADFCGRVDSFVYVISNGIAFDTATVRIDVICEELVIFSGFSPNGDNVNDEFRILGIEEFPNNRLLIFNRWGNEVYSQQGYDNSPGKVFTGRWNDKTLTDGTYFYVLDLGNGSCHSGYLQIAR